MDEMMKLVIGWTIVVAFIFTTGMTCMSLVGWIKFANKKQQQGLYAALILELVVGTATKVTDNASFDPGKSGDILRSEGAEELVATTLSELPASGAAEVDKETLEKLVGRIPAVEGTNVAKRKAGMLDAVRALPAGRVKPEDAERLRGSRVPLRPALTTGGG